MTVKSVTKDTKTLVLFDVDGTLTLPRLVRGRNISVRMPP